MQNTTSLDTLCAALCEIAGVKAPSSANAPEEALIEYAKNTFEGAKADRIFMYNPDAVAQWIYEKYPDLMREAIARTELAVPFKTVMPSVTPVCFGTMYTGAQPAVHGIQKYEKPVIRIETIFDAFIAAGKKPVIIADTACSIGKIFLEREMDYFLYSSYEEVNAKAAEIIMQDKYDLVVVYNGNYDSRMHKVGPEGYEALAELRCNSRAYGTFDELIRRYWKGHNTLVGFAMDHGCHLIDGDCGSHGLDMDEDINIVHLYKAYKKEI